MSVSQPFVPVSYKKNECTRYAEKLSGVWLATVYVIRAVGLN